MESYKSFTRFLILCMIFLIHSEVSAQDNYRSISSGNWNGASVWQKDVAGNGVYSSTATPPTAANSISITIINGHTVTVTASTDADSFTVALGGSLIVNSAQTLTIQNGPGVDLQVNGTITNNGTITLAASSVSRVAGTIANLGAFTNASATTLFFDAGSLYDHQFTTTAGTIPTASWNSNSTCQISGYTSNTTAPSGISQNFGNFTWNTPNLNISSMFDLNGLVSSISGNFSVLSTGLNDGLSLNSSHSGTVTITIAGDLIVTGSVNSYLGFTDDASTIVNCKNLTLSGAGAAFDFASAYPSSLLTGVSTLNISGNYTATSGGIYYSSGQTTGGINFNGTSVQNFTSGAGIYNSINYSVASGAIVDFGASNIISGTGNFTVQSGGTIRVGSTLGVNTGFSGNIQISGTRTYTSGSTIIFNGVAAQASGSGLPATSNININNSNGVTLNSNFTTNGTLTLTSGNLDLSVFTLTIGSSAGSIGGIAYTSGNIIIDSGSVTRWFNTSAITMGTDAGLFPVGIPSDSSRFVWISGTPTASGTVTISYTNFNGASNYGSSFSDGGITVNKRTNLFWTISTANGFNGASFGLRLRAKGIAGVSTVSDLRISLSGGIAPGTSSNGTGTTAIPEANRTGLSATNLNNSFYISSGATNTLQNVAISGNTISGTQTICSGITPTSITGSTPAGGTGSYTYSWISSTTSPSTGYAVASGTSTGINYSPSSLTQSTWYRRIVTSGSYVDTSAVAAITVNALPTITGTTPGSVCGTGTVTLGATASAGTINWYSAATGGVSLGTGTSFTTPSISSSTTYYVDATSGGCTTASRTSILASVNAIPTISGTTPGSVCGTGTVTLGATASAGTINWYSAATGGVSLGTGTSYTTPSISSSTTYYVDATSGGCTTASRTSILASVNTIPTISGTTPGSVCGTGTVTLGATASAGTINWYSAATGGVSLGTGTSFTTPSISSSTTYYVDATSGSCTTASRTSILATVNTIPTISGTTPASRCGTGTVTLGATASAGTINWYSAATGGVSLGTGTSFTTPSISSSTTYYVDATSGGCTTASRTSILATVNAIPTISGTTPGSVCGTGTVTLGATASAGTINWYSAATGGVSLGTGTSFITPSISSSTTYYVDATSGGCTTASRTSILATVNTIPTISGTTPGSVCGTGTVTLGATASAGTINWYSAATGGVSLGTGTSFTTPSISSTTNYYVDATSGGCTTASRITITAVVNTVPTITGTTPNSICGTGTVTLGATASAGTINWYSAATGGVSLGTGTSFTTPSISSSTTYYVDATSGGCTTASRTSILASVNAIPTISGTTPGSVCGTGTVTLGATASAGTINWYSAATGGVSLGTGTSFTTPSISSSTTYYVDATSGGCTTASRTSILASVNTIPTISGTTPGSVCGTGTVTLGATASAGTINWYSAATGGVSLGTGTSFTTPSISSTTTYYVDATQSGCTTASRTSVVATVNSVPSITGTTPGSVCGTGTVTLGATTSAGTINWYSAATGGVSLGTGTSFTTPSISSTTTYYTDATSGGCTTASRTSVTATVNAIPTISGTTPGTRCGTGTVTLGATASAGTINWYSSATGGSTLGTGTSFTTPSISSTTTYYVDATQGGCTTASRTSIAATVNTIPSITSTTPGSACGTSTVTLGATASAGTINWYSAATGGISLGTGASFTTPSISSTTAYYIDATASGCTTASRTSVTATINAIPTITGTTPSSRCGTGILTLGASASSGTINWYSAATGGVSLATGTSYTTPSLSANTTYYVDATSTGCTTASRTSVTASVTTIIGNNTATGSNICNGLSTTISGSLPNGGTGIFAYTWLSSVVGPSSGFATATGTNTTQSYLTPSLSQTTWYRRLTTSGSCSDTTPVTQAAVSNINVWNGTTSTAWATSTNWNCGRIPVITDSVVIPTASNLPVIIDAGRVTNTLTVNTGATLTLNNSASQLTIAGSLSISGFLVHSAGEIILAGSSNQSIPGGAYNKLTINNPAGVTLSGTVTLNDSLKFSSGMVALGAYNLILSGSTGIVYNASSSNYIRTSGTGSLGIQNIGNGGRAGAVMFPVGNSSYNPVSITNTGLLDIYNVWVVDSVTNSYSGSLPVGTKNSTNAVGRTWMVNEGTAGGSNVTMTTQWNGTDELTGFSRAFSYLSIYNGISWISATVSAASGSNPYTQTRSGITSFYSPFGVGSNGMLPVKLVKFEGRIAGNQAELTWETVSENKVSYFIIEKSNDGIEYREIGNVLALGNSTELIDYRFIDLNLSEQNNYYRLKIMDNDGQSSYSDIVILQKNKSSNVLIFPNPVSLNSPVNISLPDGQKYFLEITDLNGKIVRTLSNSEATNGVASHMVLLDTQEFSSGSYVVNIKNAAGLTIKTCKLLIL